MAKFQEARRASARQQVPAPVAKVGASSRRASVQAYSCVDCGEQFFEVDFSAKKIAMVDGKPVCAVCLKKRRGIGLWALLGVFAAACLVLLFIFPLQVLIGVVVISVGAIGVALYHSNWALTVRLGVILAAFSAAGLSLITHHIIRSSALSAADDEAVRPFYADCAKAYESKNPIALRDALSRAEQAVERLNYPVRQRGQIDLWRQKRDSLLDKTDPFGTELYWYLSTKIPIDVRWGKPAVKSTKSKEEPGGGRTVTIEMYAPESYAKPDGWNGVKREIEAVMSAVIYWNRKISKISLTVYAPRDGSDVVVGRFGLSREGFSKWLTNSREEIPGQRIGAELMEFCDPQEWTP